jgi:hypothetical protein
MTTIRERIITAVVTRLGNIRLAKGYATDAGANVFRSVSKIDPDSLPCVVFWAGEEEYSHEYGNVSVKMPFAIEALSGHAGTKAVKAEELLGDLLECVLGVVKTYTFTLGTSAVAVGDTLTGAVSGATGYVEAITVSGGSWAGGNAAGTVVLRRVTGDFQSESCTKLKISASFTSNLPEAAFTGGLGRIAVLSGAIETYPDEDRSYVGGKLTGSITYETIGGNPYAQP